MLNHSHHWGAQMKTANYFSPIRLAQFLETIIQCWKRCERREFSSSTHRRETEYKPFREKFDNVYQNFFKSKPFT